VHGRGPRFVSPALPLALPLRVQLQAESGACWEARFGATGVRENGAIVFDGKGE